MNRRRILTNNVKSKEAYNPSLLCFTAEAPASSVTLKNLGSPNAINLQISTDMQKTWEDYAFGDEIILEYPNDSVFFRNKSLTPTGFSLRAQYYCFKTTGTLSVSGDVTSLISFWGGDVSLRDEGIFWRLFDGSEGISTAPNLPSTRLSASCYAQMFRNAKKMRTAPALPATIVEESCYLEMFYGCASLENAPALPSLTLKKKCYQNMFSNCKSLETAPLLPALTLAEDCYKEMFMGCASLSHSPEIVATNFVHGSLIRTFKGTSLIVTETETENRILNCRTLSGAGQPVTDAFADTLGDFEGTPEEGHEYYLGNKLYLYKAGDECEKITGGYECFGYLNSTVGVPSPNKKTVGDNYIGVLKPRADWTSYVLRTANDLSSLLKRFKYLYLTFSGVYKFSSAGIYYDGSGYSIRSGPIGTAKIDLETFNPTEEKYYVGINTAAYLATEVETRLYEAYLSNE